jgi:hypothetical protein
MAKAKNKRRPAAPKVSDSRLAAHPRPSDPQHGEWLIDEGSDESYPASDPSSVAQPRPTSRKKKDPAA